MADKPDENKAEKAEAKAEKSSPRTAKVSAPAPVPVPEWAPPSDLPGLKAEAERLQVEVSMADAKGDVASAQLLSERLAVVCQSLPC
jgi:hypothetical protein